MKPFALRLKSDDNFNKVVKLSEKENRSINGQFNELINEALTTRELK